MSRRHLTFTCKGETLAGTLDDAPGKVGLLIVTGGNEIRAGAFSGQAKLAHHIAENGYPVFRFDRRGVGNSGGENGGYTSSQPDIAAAKAAFLAAAPQVECIVAHGNCDAATAVMAFSAVDARIVSNSWVYGDGGEDTGAAPPAAAIRSRYAEKLKNPREVLRLLTGGVSLGKLFRGLLAAIKPRPASHCDEALRIAALVESNTPPLTILLAGRDRTAQYFAANWDPADPRRKYCPDADHSFSSGPAQEWYFNQLLAALHEQARQLDMG